MRFKTWIIDSFDEWVGFKVVCESVGTGDMLFHSDLKSLESSDGKIAVEDGGSSSDRLGVEEELITEFLIIDNESSHDDIGVSTDVLRGGMEDDIATELEGSLEIHGGKSVVAENETIISSLLSGDFDDGLDINNLEGWVGWGLDPDHSGLVGE